MSDPAAPIEVFYSYAEADEPLREELDKHLKQLQHDGLIIPWHKRLITSGTDWTKEIDQHLNTASVILLLISADFVASAYCYGTEMQRAMERHKTGEAHVIPIRLRHIGDWQSAPFGKLQALPSNGKPVMAWSDRDDAFANIAQDIRKVVEQVRRPRTSAISSLQEKKTGEEARILPGTTLLAYTGHLKEDRRIGTLLWSPDGKQIASIGTEEIGPYKIHIWNAETAERSLLIDLTRRYEPGIEKIVLPTLRFFGSIGDMVDKITFWDVISKKLLRQTGLPLALPAAWSPDGTQLATVLIDGTIHLWDTQTTSRPLFTYKTSSDFFYSAFHSIVWPDSGNGIRDIRLATANVNKKSISVWNTQTKSISQFTHPGQVVSIAWSLDGTKLASVDLNGAVSIWTHQEGNKHLFTYADTSAQIASIALSSHPDGIKLASVDLNGAVSIWSSQTQRSSLRHPLLADTTSTVTKSAIKVVTWSPPDGKKLAAVRGDGTIHIWNTHMGGTPLVTYTRHQKEIVAVVWSPDGKKLASADTSGSVLIWQG